MSLRYSLDTITLRDDRVFGWGWLLNERSPAIRIQLTVRYDDGGESHLRCQQSGARPDLVEVFPDVAHAGGGGFLIQGRLRRPAVGAVLQAWFADGSHEELAVPGFPERYLPQAMAGGWHGKWEIARQLLHRGDWRLLSRRALAMLQRRGAGLWRRANGWRGSAGGSGQAVMVFDHAMGGGANHFRAEKVSEWLAAGQEVVLVTPHLATLSYEVTCLAGSDERIARYSTLAECLAALPDAREIVVNSLVSYDDPGQVLDWIEARQRPGLPVTYCLHDFHAACPVWTLVGSDGRYCGIPDFDRCARCLPANDAPFLALMPSLDVPAWREKWLRFLLRADTIIAFSKASVPVLRKAFPELPIERISVQPHRTDYIRPQRVDFRLDLPLVIGVVGSINVYKGAGIVAEMAGIIEREQLPARIVVIGTIDNVSPSPALRITGAYRSEALPDMLRREGVGICLLPSICHETFSYVTAELMAYGMPLAVFDLGAPAERVRTYPLGGIIPAVDARVALDTLLKLRTDLLAREPGDGGGLLARQT